MKPHPPQARLHITASLLTVGVSKWICAVVAVPFMVSVSPCRCPAVLVAESNRFCGFRDSDSDTAVSILDAVSVNNDGEAKGQNLGERNPRVPCACRCRTHQKGMPFGAETRVRAGHKGDITPHGTD